MHVNLLRRSLLLVASAVLPVAAQSNPQPPTRNIPYVTDATGTYKADLYQPAGPGPFPALVFIHGGSWLGGNKDTFKRLAADLAQRGYVGFSINYDLHSRSFPISWEESRAAVRFLRAHAAQYHVDPTRIAIVGTSAGGELAALVGIAPQGPAIPTPGISPDSTSASVSAAVILNGVFDLSPSVYVIHRYLGGHCDKVKLCDDASPLQHVHPDAPPFFVGHGDADGLVPFSQAQVFTAALQAAHDPVTLYVAPHGGHMYWTKKSFYQQNLAAMESFLSTALQSPPTPTAGTQ